MRCALPLILFVAMGCSPSSAREPSAGAGGAGTGGAGTGGAGAGGVESSPIAPSTTQLLVVVSDSWTSSAATLQRYESSSSSHEWSSVGAAVPVVIGKNGLGWGIGLHPLMQDGGPTKHEGDGRSPAGVFTLGTAFGYATADAASWIHMPYTQATDDLECVDDPSSSHYNTLVKKSGVSSVDWNSSEMMKRPDSLYRWGMFVDHNANPPHAGDGSCIFLHLWSGASSTTVGCTAGEESLMQELIGWLEPDRHPVLVQLPAPVYDALEGDWALPPN